MKYHKNDFGVVKILLTLTLLAAGGLLVFYLQKPGDTGFPKKQSVTFYKTKEECEQQNSRSCRGPLICDHIPNGKTYNEVCGKGFFDGAWSAK